MLSKFECSLSMCSSESKEQSVLQHTNWIKTCKQSSNEFSRLMRRAGRTLRFTDSSPFSYVIFDNSILSGECHRHPRSGALRSLTSVLGTKFKTIPRLHSVVGKNQNCLRITYSDLCQANLHKLAYWDQSEQPTSKDHSPFKFSTKATKNAID